MAKQHAKPQKSCLEDEAGYSLNKKRRTKGRRIDESTDLRLLCKDETV